VLKEESEIDYKAKYEDLKRKLEEQARRIQTLEAEKADLCKDKTALSDKLSNLQINGKLCFVTHR
jgi:chromosome segregation ATPase